MDPTPELIMDIDRDRIERARQMPPAQRMLAGGDLFDAMAQRMADGIRMQNPGADTQTVRAILRERLAIARRLESCA